MNKLFIVHSVPYIGEMKSNSYQEATQAEIDDAASEQMKQDAEIGKALNAIVGSDIYSQATIVFSNHGGRIAGEKASVCVSAYMPGKTCISTREQTLYAALEAAGLVEEGNRG